jgi:GntR family galactonate operon transcriptional repressor
MPTRCSRKSFSAHALRSAYRIRILAFALFIIFNDHPIKPVPRQEVWRLPSQSVYSDDMTYRDASFLHPVRPRKRNLFAYVVDELGNRIVRGDLRPGDTLPNEAELGREMGASRSVVREAVKSLASKGLLESRTRTGTRVLAPIHWNLLDLDVLSWRFAAMPRMQFFSELFELRGMIEPAAAALAAEHGTDADLASLADAFDAMQAADPASAAAIEADLRFHRAILAACYNELLSQMGGVIGVGLLTSFRMTSRSYSIFLPLHRQVLDGITARRPQEARKAMEQLLQRTREFLERELAGSNSAPISAEMPRARAL